MSGTADIVRIAACATVSVLAPVAPAMNWTAANSGISGEIGQNCRTKGERQSQKQKQTLHHSETRSFVFNHVRNPFRFCRFIVSCGLANPSDANVQAH